MSCWDYVSELIQLSSLILTEIQQEDFCGLCYLLLVCAYGHVPGLFCSVSCYCLDQ